MSEMWDTDTSVRQLVLTPGFIDLHLFEEDLHPLELWCPTEAVSYLRVTHSI